MKPRSVLILLLGVFLGYILHSQVQSLLLSSQKIVGLSASPQASPGYNPQDEFIKYVDFKDGHFSAQEMVVNKGSYLAVTNKSVNNSEKMWLISDYPELNTQRPYFSSERLQVALTKVGSYTVKEKENGAAFSVMVK